MNAIIEDLKKVSRWRWTDQSDRAWPVEVVPAWALDKALEEIERLDAAINTAHTDDFLEAVRLEAAHQRERWAAEHDAGKTDVDWFWLIGYLAGKAIHKPEKLLHHIITTAAACLNWHAARTGADTRMRPGIEPPGGGGVYEPVHAAPRRLLRQ